MRTMLMLSALLAALAGIAWYVWLVVSGSLATNYTILFLIAAFLVGLASGLFGLLRKKPAESAETKRPSPQKKKKR